MRYCTHCGGALDSGANFCTQCGTSPGGAGHSAAQDLPVLLKDLEFGPAGRKLEAIGRLSSLKGVRLTEVRSALVKVLSTASDGELLKLGAAYMLAVLGDTSDLVVDALDTFMSARPFDGPGDTLVEFPWITDAEKHSFHPDADYLGRRGRRSSPQIARIEAFGYMRGCESAAMRLRIRLEDSENKGFRLIAIYAAGANGHPSLRSILEYLRDREPGSAESQAASLALDHFGTSTLLEIAELHAGLAPKEEARKSGCFIATAVYGPTDCQE